MSYTPEQLRQWAEFVAWDEPDYRKPSVKEISAQLDAHAAALEERQALVEALMNVCNNPAGESLADAQALLARMGE